MEEEIRQRAIERGKAAEKALETYVMAENGCDYATCSDRDGQNCGCRLEVEHLISHAAKQLK